MGANKRQFTDERQAELDAIFETDSPTENQLRYIEQLVETITGWGLKIEQEVPLTADDAGRIIERLEDYLPDRIDSGQRYNQTDIQDKLKQI